MSLVQKVLFVGGVGVGLVSLIRGQLLLPWPSGRPAPPPWMARAYGLALVLLAAGLIARAELHGSELHIGLFLAAMLVLLVGGIVAWCRGI